MGFIRVGLDVRHLHFFQTCVFGPLCIGKYIARFEYISHIDHIKPNKTFLLKPQFLHLVIEKKKIKMLNDTCFLYHHSVTNTLLFIKNMPVLKTQKYLIRPTGPKNKSVFDVRPLETNRYPMVTVTINTALIRHLRSLYTSSKLLFY